MARPATSGRLAAAVLVCATSVGAWARMGLRQEPDAPGGPTGAGGTESAAPVAVDVPLLRTLAVSPRDDLVAVGRSDGSVSLLDAATSGLIRTLEPGLESGVWVLEFSPDGELLAGLGDDGALRLWRAGQPAAGEDGADGAIRVGMPDPERIAPWPFGARILWSPDGDRLAVVHSGGHVSLWTRDGELVTRWDGARRRTDHSVAWHRDGVLLLAEDQVVKRRDGLSGRYLEPVVRCERPIVTLALHPTEDLLATGHADCELAIWSLETGERVAGEHFRDPWLIEEDDEVASIAWSPSGDRIALSIRVGSHVFVVDAESLASIWTSPYYGAHFGEAMPVRWSPDGRRLWFAFECGRGPVVWVEPAERALHEFHEDTRLPVFGGSVGAVVVGGELRLLPADGALPW